MILVFTMVAKQLARIDRLKGYMKGRRKQQRRIEGNNGKPASTTELAK